MKQVVLQLFAIVFTSVAAAGSPTALGLPEESAVRHALEQSPRLQIAHEAISTGMALQQRHRVGPHEWEIAVTAQRRTDAAGNHRDEQEFGLQRGMRWPWKSSLDRQIGARARDVGELSYVDAWHEACRALLDLWFAWLDAERGLRVLDDQLDVLLTQQQTVTRKVDAGDAAQLELQLAIAETRRLQATRADTAREAFAARESLLREFPDLNASLPVELPEPIELPDNDGTWVARIGTANHEIELAKARAEESRLAAERAVRDRLADPTVGLRYSDNLDGDRKVIGLQFSLPLGGVARSATAALARSTARVADSEVARTRHAVESDARSAVSAARLRYRSWRDLAEVERQMRETAAAVTRGYELGEFDLSTMLASRRMSLESRRTLDSAQLVALRAHARVLLDAHQLWALPHDEADHDAAGSTRTGNRSGSQ